MSASVSVKGETVRRATKSVGASDNVIAEMLEMYRATDSGLLAPAEPRTVETTTPTTLGQFAREILAPLVAAPVGAHA